MGSHTTSAVGSAVYSRRESVVRSYCRHYEMEFDTALGSVVRDTTGREYVDFLAGAGALTYGHNDPDMADALSGALSLPDVTRLPYDGYLAGLDSADLLELLLSDGSSGVDAPAAVLVESVQGEGGLNAASPDRLRRVAALAREHGAALVLDVARRSALVRVRLDRIAGVVSGARTKGRGMMQGLDAGRGRLAARICRRAGAAGLIVETSGADDEVVKVLAPLTTPDELLSWGLDVLEDAAVACVGSAAAQ